MSNEAWHALHNATCHEAEEAGSHVCSQSSVSDKRAHDHRPANHSILGLVSASQTFRVHGLLIVFLFPLLWLASWLFILAHGWLRPAAFPDACVRNQCETGTRPSTLLHLNTAPLIRFVVRLLPPRAPT